VIGVQDEQHFEGPGQHRIGLVAGFRHLPHHREEVLREAQRVIGVHEGHAPAVAVGRGGQRGHLGDEPDDLGRPDLGVLDLLGLGIERRQGGDPGYEHPHRVGVVMEAVDEPLAEVLVDVGVVPDVVRPGFQLGGVGQLAVDQQIGDFEVGRLGRQLLDRVPAVAQDAGIAVQVRDGTGCERGRHECRVVEPDARKELAEVVRRHSAVGDRYLYYLTRSVVGNGDGFSHSSPYRRWKKHSS
jgi:hypothetical protein